MSKRLELLRRAVESGNGDAFAMYGLAMEYRSLERFEEAHVAFQRLRERHPDYVPAYLMCAQTLERMGMPDKAREWLGAGIEAARSKGDAHALSEIESALAALPDAP